MRVIELGREGKSKAAMCCEFMVTRDTLYEWAKVYPEFSDALDVAAHYSQLWWEEQAHKGLWDKKNFDSGLWRMIAGARFKDYQKVTKLDISSTDGSLQAMSKEQIEDKLKAIHAAALERSRQAAKGDSAYDDGADLV